MVRLHVEGERDGKRALARSAQKIWLRIFGNARCADDRRKRSDAGVKRAARDADLSQTAFVKRRRAAAAAAAADVTRTDAEQEIRAAPAGASWSASHAKEEAFAKNKAEQRRVQASREGALLPAENSLALQAAAATQVQKMKDDQQKR